jgi:formylglycine-generating enzyme required for sulfatase activity
LNVKTLSIFILVLFIPLMFWNSRPGNAPAGMALVPAGEFIMGTNETTFSVDPVSVLPAPPKLVDAGPTHTVYLDSFYIDLHKVSTADYRKFSDKMGKKSGGDSEPFDLNDAVTGVAWKEADDYCRSVGKRLPTEEEWEKASRGTDGRVYPWGNQLDFKIENAAITLQSENTRSPYGVEKMVGSGWEWTSDWYRPYPNNPYRSSTFWEGYRVIRGGSWRDQPAKMIDLLSRTTTRFYFHPDQQDGTIGFRCAMSAS